MTLTGVFISCVNKILLSPEETCLFPSNQNHSVIIFKKKKRKENQQKRTSASILVILAAKLTCLLYFYEMQASAHFNHSILKNARYLSSAYQQFYNRLRTAEYFIKTVAHAKQLIFFNSRTQRVSLLIIKSISIM